MARLIRSGLVFVALLLVSGAAMAEPVSAILGAIGSAVGAGAATSAAAIAVGGMIVTTAVSIASSAYASSQQKKAARAAQARKWAEDVANLQSRMQTLVSSEAPHTVVYGSPGPIGGALVNMLTGGAAEEMKFAFLVFAAHECDGFEEIYIGGIPVGINDMDNGWSKNPEFQVPGLLPFLPPTNTGVTVMLHTSPGGVDTADAGVMGWQSSGIYAGQYNEAHKMSGFTYAIVGVSLFVEKFQGGLPEITAKLRGKKVYDPRTGQTVYSRNPALCLADFLKSEQGYGALAEQIDENALIAAANACDEEVYAAYNDPRNYGDSTKRYVCDGMFRTDQDRESVRQQIEDSMAGFSLESGGVWRIQAGAWSTPILSLTDADMLEPVKVLQTCNPTQGRYNGAKGTYVNAAGNGVTEDYTPYQNATFRALDPKDKWLDCPLSFTGSHVRAHQIARVKVEQSRGGFVIQISPKMFAWHLQPGDRVTVSNAMYVFSNKTFRVQDWAYSMGSPVALQLVEDVPAYYDLGDEVLADAAPNTALPNPFLAPPIPSDFAVESGDEHVLQQGGSLIVRALLEWTKSVTQGVLYGGSVRVQWRLMETSSAFQTIDIPGDSDRFYLSGLAVGGTYQIRIRFQTAYTVGDWATITHVVVGKAQPPANVSGLTLGVEPKGILATWQQPTDLDLLDWSTTQLRVGATWADGVEVFRGKATHADLGWFPAGTLKVWAAHGNSVNQYSTPISATLEILNPGQPVVDGEVHGSEVELYWTDATTTQPIAHYELRVGNVYADATIVGRVNGLGFVRSEQEAGTRLYWVAAVDAAGNRGTQGYKELTTLPTIDDAIEILTQDLDAAVESLLNVGSDLSDRIVAEAAARGTAITNLQNLVTEGDEQLAEQISLISAAAVGYTRANLQHNGGFELELDGWTGNTAGFAVFDGSLGRSLRNPDPAASGIIYGKKFAAAEGLWYAVAADLRSTSATGTVRVGIEFLGSAEQSLLQVDAPAAGTSEFSNDSDRRGLRAEETLAPANTAWARAYFRWATIADPGAIGVRQVKVEQGRLPITAYTAESTTLGIVAAVQTEASARASAVAAEASARQSLAASVDGLSAAIDAESTVRADQYGQLSARWGIKTTVDGKVAGIVLNNDGQETSFVVLANTFAFAQEGEGPGEFKYPFTIGSIAGVSSMGINANVFLDGTLKGRVLEADTITGDKIKANELEARHIKAGSITTDLLAVGTGGNLLSNSSWMDRSTYNIPTGWVLGANPASWEGLAPANFTAWVPPSDQGVALWQKTAEVGAVMLIDSKFTVEGGKRYNVSVYSGAHRCTIYTQIYWYDGNGTVISVSSDAAVTNTGTHVGGKVLSTFKRIGCFGVAPSGAASGMFRITKTGTTSGADSYAFLVRPMAAEATASQTNFSPYVPSGLGVKITAQGITTPSLEALSGVMGNLYSGSVRGGSYTGYAWPAAGTNGYYLGPEGLLLGNYNNGRYVQITGDGNFFAPGMSVVNGALTIAALNVVGSGQLAAGAAGGGLAATGNNTAAIGVYVPPGEVHQFFMVAYFPGKRVVNAGGPEYSMTGIGTVTPPPSIVYQAGGGGAEGEGVSVIYYPPFTQPSMFYLGAGSHTLVANGSGLNGIYLAVQINRKPS